MCSVVALHQDYCEHNSSSSTLVMLQPPLACMSFQILPELVAVGRCLLLGSSPLDRWRRLRMLVPESEPALACWLGQELGL